MATEPATQRRNGRTRQIEFPPLQTHSKAFEAFMVGFSFLCVVIVLVIVLGTDIGTLTR
jgi:hypothetical protein